MRPVVRIQAGDPLPSDVAVFTSLDGDASVPVFLNDVFLVTVGTYCWILPADHHYSGAGVYLPGPGFWTFVKSVVNVMTIRSWSPDESAVPASVAGIDLSGGSTWSGPVTWSFDRGDTVPDWLITSTSDDPDTGVSFEFGGDVVVVDLSYGTWILPTRAVRQTTAITPKTWGGGKIVARPAGRDILWPAYVVVGFNDWDGGGGGGDEPVDPVAPVSPVLEPA